MYTHNGTTDVRMWILCIDNPTERLTWEMEYSVDAREKNLIVVSSGEHQSYPIFNEEGTLKTFCFKEEIPTQARYIILAVGPFEVLEEGDTGFGVGINVTHYCLPGRMALMRQSVQFLSRVPTDVLLLV